MKESFIVNGVRTPIGNYKGTLSAIRTDDLGALVIREIMERNPLIPAYQIDDVIMGCANQAGEDNRNVARMSLLLETAPRPAARLSRSRGKDTLRGHGRRDPADNL